MINESIEYPSSQSDIVSNSDIVPNNAPLHYGAELSCSTLHSAIYHGTVRHRRFTPKFHHFTYRVFMVYLDLAEMDTVFSKSRWWSNKGFSLAWFRRKDFFDGAGDTAAPSKGGSSKDGSHTAIKKPKIESLYDSVADKVFDELGERPSGPIRMLTNLRYFGFIINPITCYYCFDATGEVLETVVAEVTNTPWGHRKHYVLDCKANEPREGRASNKQRMTFMKGMHVSPFQPMHLQYCWQGKTPADDLLVHLDVFDNNNQESDQPIFDATLVLQRQEMTSKNMNRIVFCYPWMTAKVFLGIYWQALKLWKKKIPFYGNPV